MKKILEINEFSIMKLPFSNYKSNRIVPSPSFSSFKFETGTSGIEIWYASKGVVWLFTKPKKNIGSLMQKTMNFKTKINLLPASLGFILPCWLRITTLSICTYLRKTVSHSSSHHSSYIFCTSDLPFLSPSKFRTTKI